MQGVSEEREQVAGFARQVGGKVAVLTWVLEWPDNIPLHNYIISTLVSSFKHQSLT